MPVVETFERVEQRNIEFKERAKSDTNSDCESKTLDFIKDCLEVSNNPICLCSFGKDSLVLLHLILRIKKIPVIYWREPFFQSKFSHPQKIAEMWDLEIYDYPPTFIDYLQLEDYFDVYNYYYAGNNQYINLYTGIRKYRNEDKKYLCAIKDLLLRPKISKYEFKWNCIFHGHKQSDKVYIADKIDLPKIRFFGDRILSLPLKDWQDKDIWEYIYKYNLPFNKNRYSNEDEKFNNDIFPTCYDCLDYRNIGKEVICPKINKPVACLAKTKEENEKFRNNLLNMAYK